MGQKHFEVTLIMFLYIFCPITTSFAQSLNTSKDESSLLHIRSLITSDPNNVLSTNWSQGTSFCTWIGVVCSPRRQRVVSLNLFDFGLTGMISPQIGNLSFLTYLDVANNSFTGQIPYTVGNLFRLRELRMEFNMLSENIPASLVLLQNLEILDLSYNNLRESVPWDIFNISKIQEISLAGNGELSGHLPSEICTRPTRLQRLRLSFNRFYGEIPRGLTSCVELRIVYMSSNNFTGNLPEGIGNLLQLEFLALRGNQLRGTIPPSLGNLSNLVALDLDLNNFEALPSEMGHLSSLTILNIGGNKLIGELPSSIFNLTRLQRISLPLNQLTGNLPNDMSNLSLLQYLALGRNQLTGTVPPSLGNLSNLVILDLSQNNFQGTVPSRLGHLSNLTLLSLGTNMLNGELPSSVFNLTRLQVISLTINRLTGTLPSAIDVMLPNIQIMYLGANNFSGQIPITLSNLSHLTVFDIGNNSFTGLIPINLGNLRNLKVLRLVTNQFTNNLSIPGQEFLTSVVNCRNLTNLNFMFNPITGVLPISIGNLSTSLEQFLAGGCRIEGTIPNEIGNINSLVALDIGSNNLTGEIPATVGSLINLQLLTLSSNNLHNSLPESLCSLENLYNVDFSGNILSGQLPMCLGNLSSLRELYLDNNSFNSTIPPTLWHNTRIQILSLAGNFFYGSLPIEISNLQNLQELHLLENQFSGNIPLTIGELRSLINLQLQNNRFDGAIPSSLSNLIDLQYLDLSQNHLSGSIPMSLENLRLIDYFNVSFNELNGEIPEGGRFGKFTSESFMGNRELCGASRLGVEACRTNSRQIKRLLMYILLPLGSTIFLLVIILLARSYGRKTTISSNHSDSHPGNTHQRISYYEILRATNSLDVENLIGKGSTSSVFTGTFSNGMVAAVKVFDLEIQSAFKSFDTECEIMGKLRHRNLVKVITSCSNLDFKSLVIDYMPNGNLDKWFYSPDCAFSFLQRLQIMVDVASALEYLHHGYSFPIVHCDLKPNNILLDEHMVAHVADFGISKLMMEDQRMEQTKTFGTIGYMAPEYGSSGLVSTMADVYSYGILLMETLTRKKPTHELFSGELTMHKWVSESYQSNIMQIIDVELHNAADEKLVKSNTKECLRLILELALQCSSHLPEERPNMKEVSARLNKINMKLDSSLV